MKQEFKETDDVLLLWGESSTSESIIIELQNEGFEDVEENSRNMLIQISPHTPLVPFMNLSHEFLNKNNNKNGLFQGTPAIRVVCANPEGALVRFSYTVMLKK